MNTLLKDFRHGVRSLLKRPAFALVAVIVLALGIGANTKVFSVMDSVMLRTLPVSHPEQIVEIQLAQPAAASILISLIRFTRPCVVQVQSLTVCSRTPTPILV